MSYYNNFGNEAGLTDDPSITNMAAFEVKSVRLGFIRKVYGILAIMLTITFGFVLAVSLSESARLTMRQNTWLLWVGMGMYLVTVLTLVCSKDLARKVPHNFIGLGFVGLSQIITLSVVAGVVAPESISIALGITALITLVLTAFAFQTKIDFTVYTGMVTICLFALMMFGLVCMFFPRVPMMHTVYSCLGAILFSFFILIDTQMIIGGTKSLEIHPEDYVMAVLILYMDIIQLFMYILQILNSRN